MRFRSCGLAAPAEQHHRPDRAGDTDQDIGTAAAANLVPTDSDGLVLGRTATQVLNVVFQSSAAVTGSGFFPAGLNGTILTSGAG